MTSLIYCLLLGLAAGTVAKMLTPQQESGGWLFSIGLGLLGSYVGQFLFKIIGLQPTNLIGSLLAAIIGAVLVLFIYYRFIAKKS